MTLCLAWKQGNEVFIASDSRLSNYNGIVSDDASKIFKIEVKIYGPMPANQKNATEPLLIQTTYGMCFSGSYLNGSTIADTIEEVLSNIQGSPERSDFSIEALIDIAFSIYKQVSNQLMAIHNQFGLSTVLIGGYCPLNSEFGLFRFKASQANPNEPIVFENLKINLEEEGIYYIGDQTAIERSIELSKNLEENYTYFHVLREIIRDNNFRSVGGNIQAAKFHPTSFETFGIAEHSVAETEAGPQIVDKYTFRGFALDLDQEAVEKYNLIIKKKMFNPFQHERDEQFKRIMRDHWGVA